MEVNELLVDAICCANYSQLQGGSTKMSFWQLTSSSSQDVLNKSQMLFFFL